MAMATIISYQTASVITRIGKMAQCVVGAGNNSARSRSMSKSTTVTYLLAMAAGQDAGNRSMRRAGRS